MLQSGMCHKPMQRGCSVTHCCHAMRAVSCRHVDHLFNTLLHARHMSAESFTPSQSSADGSAVRPPRQTHTMRPHPYAPPSAGRRPSATPPSGPHTPLPPIQGLSGLSRISPIDSHSNPTFGAPYTSGHPVFHSPSIPDNTQLARGSLTNHFAFNAGTGRSNGASQSDANRDPLDVHYPLPGRIPGHVLNPTAYPATSANRGAHELEQLFVQFNLEPLHRRPVYDFAQVHTYFTCLRDQCTDNLPTYRGVHRCLVMHS